MFRKLLQEFCNFWIFIIDETADLSTDFLDSRNKIVEIRSIDP